MYNRFDIINARKNRGWTQEILACTLGVSRQYLSKIENGSKPINDSMLAWLEKEMDTKRHVTLPTPKKRSQKGADKVRKTKALELLNRPDIVHFDKVTDFSNSKPPDDNKEWEKRWWKSYHALCLKCKEECKQSSHVRIIVCPQCEVC